MKKVTLADVAERAGVSVALVSIVLRDAPGAAAATRERVLRAAQEIGYAPDRQARLLRSGRSRLLGVVFGVEHAFHGDLVTGLYEAAAKQRYELTLSAVTPRRDERTAVLSLLQDRCEALLLLGPTTPAASLGTLAERLPVVVLARGVKNLDCVRTADADGLEQAVDHLVGLGHRRIAHIDGGGAPGSVDRRRGYRAAMKRHGLEEHLHVTRGGPGEGDGSRATREVGGRETAVTVFNDRCATGVLETLRSTGRETVSVTGFDDSRLARLSHVDLTTIAQDTDAMAELAVARALARIDGTPEQAKTFVVPPRLVVRGSTSARAAPAGRR